MQSRSINPIVPLHSRMRASDRDLIREGHYGQRSCEPRKQAEHMAAPTNSANVKISLANSEPSTHGTWRTFNLRRRMSALEGKAVIDRRDAEMHVATRKCTPASLAIFRKGLFNRVCDR